MTDRYPPQKLAANRAAKQEEYENSHKLSAQFRSLDPDEINFLDEVAVRRFEEEKKVREGDEEMLKGFRACVLFLLIGVRSWVPLSVLERRALSRVHVRARVRMMCLGAWLCSSLLGRSTSGTTHYLMSGHDID
jgi:FAM192A/Fyv6, N-terminal domain